MIRRVLLACACLLIWAVAPVGAAEPSPQALSIYEDGKRAYDAGDYTTALRRFSEVSRLEPENPRWHYNLGLARRQLGHYAGAEAAFRRVAALDPEYKKAEIAQKLAHMEDDVGSERGRSGHDDARVFFYAFGGIVLAIIAGVLIVRRRRRQRVAAHASKAALKIDPQLLRAFSARLDALRERLVPIEHAMRFGEDADLRRELECATDLELAVARSLAVPGADGMSASRLAARLDEAEALAAGARQRALAGFGPHALEGQGERVGCWFCARPLANAEFRRRLPLTVGGRTSEVLACPPCAEQAARGIAPELRGRGEGAGFQHWSEDGNFDPYAERHRPSTRQVPSWDFRPAQGIAPIARLAAGGALAAAGTAAVVSLLDLDAARETGLAQQAASAAARHARNERSDSIFRDHS